MPINAEKLKESLNVDLERAVRELGLTAPVYERILRVSVSSAEMSLSDFTAAIDQADYGRLQQMAHDWKGVFANMRVDKLSALAAEMDRIARIGSGIEMIRPLAEEFKRGLQLLKSVFY